MKVFILEIDGVKYYCYFEKCNKGDLTLFPDTINGIPDFSNLTSANIEKARWDYVLSTSCFKLERIK